MALLIPTRLTWMCRSNTSVSQVLGVHLTPVARGQDGDVDTTVSVANPSCCSCDRLRIGDVQGDDEHASTGDLVECCLPTGGYRDRRPRDTSSRAVAAPMPLDAPTTQTTLPRRFTRMPA
jgi:hypothetical protein